MKEEKKSKKRPSKVEEKVEKKVEAKVEKKLKVPYLKAKEKSNAHVPTELISGLRKGSEFELCGIPFKVHVSQGLDLVLRRTDIK